MSKTKTKKVFMVGDRVSFRLDGWIYYGTINRIYSIAGTARISVGSRVGPGFSPDPCVFAYNSRMRDPGVVCALGLLEKRAI